MSRRTHRAAGPRRASQHARACRTSAPQRVPRRLTTREIATDRRVRWCLGSRRATSAQCAATAPSTQRPATVLGRIGRNLLCAAPDASACRAMRASCAMHSERRARRRADATFLRMALPLTRRISMHSPVQSAHCFSLKQTTAVMLYRHVGGHEGEDVREQLRRQVSKRRHSCDYWRVYFCVLETRH